MVIAAEGTPNIPQGRSFWEFGCDENAKGKADNDYKNRTAATPKPERMETTFVFVTPRDWSGKQKWEDARRAQGQWKDVRALDASDLEQWLEQSIPGQAWFAAETHRPANGTQSLDKCWADWSTVCDPPLVGSLFSTAIKVAGGIVASRLAKPPQEPTVIAADSVEEGLAFLSQLFNDPNSELGAHRDRVVVFREPGVLPKIAAGSSNFIAVAATRDVERELAPYCRAIHCFAVYPRNAANAEPHVVLEPLHATPFSTSLEEMKFGKDKIERLAHESGRSLTVLRRRLATVPAIRTPEWAADATTAARLVPFLLAGAWSSTNTGDQAIVSLLSNGTAYPALEKNLQALTLLNDAPVWSVGTYRGVVSTMDLLFAIGGTITQDEIKTFFDVARLVLSEDDPSLDLPEEDRWTAAWHGKAREISSVLRQSISGTLVLLAVHGNELLQKRLGLNVEALVVQLVRELLTPLTARTLEAQERDLPTYAEAAPSEFLAILEADLNSPAPASLQLMRPAETGIFGRCLRTGLLWALEGLAWSPSTLSRTALVLAKLARVQIDDNWMNKPIESLRAIFRAWMPQTEATLEQRIAVMKLLADESPDVAWQICIDQFGASGQVGHYSRKPRWRNDGHGFGEPLRNSDVHGFVIAMIDMALTWKNHNRETLGDLITRLPSLDDDGWQTTVWDLVKRWADAGASDSDKAWVREKIRVTILSQRAARRNLRNKTDALKATALTTAANAAYKALEPADILSKHEWLFRKDWVEESADELHEDTDYRKRDERIQKLRTEALREVLARRGVEGVLKLAEMGEAPGRIGSLMTSLLSEAELVGFLLTAMPPGTVAAARRNIVYGALHALNEGSRTDLFAKLEPTLAPRDLVEIMKLAPFSNTTWVSVARLDDASQKAYWAEVVPDWWHQSDDDLNVGVERLLAAKRPRAAFSFVHFVLEKIRPALLFRLLSEVAAGTDEPSGQYRLDGYRITEAFKALDESGEFSTDKMAGLEFPYIEALARTRGMRDARGIPNLERYVEEHPEFFAEVVAWVFRRSDGKEDPQDMKIVDASLAKNRAERGYRLLDALERIPGRNKLGEIDADKLLTWLTTVRRLCSSLGRPVTGDIVLGELIANAPLGADDVWPCEPVRDVLERVKAPDIARGIRTGLYNQRGAHWRGEGGDQERELANKYRAWATAMEFSHPYVAAIMKGMADSYDEEAKGRDTEAKVERRLR